MGPIADREGRVPASFDRFALLLHLAPFAAMAKLQRRTTNSTKRKAWDQMWDPINSSREKPN
jgi:hypothetical protein